MDVLKKLTNFAKQLNIQVAPTPYWMKEINWVLLQAGEVIVAADDEYEDSQGSKELLIALLYRTIDDYDQNYNDWKKGNGLDETNAKKLWEYRAAILSFKKLLGENPIPDLDWQLNANLAYELRSVKHS